MIPTDPTAILHFDNLELDTHIRVLVQDDQPLFILKDVCDNLGHTNSRMASEGLDPDELVSVKLTSGGQNRSLQAVTESGLYALIFKSRKDAAKKFRKWVTGEVLPAIRRQGRYDAAEFSAALPAAARHACLLAEAETHHSRAAFLRHQAELCLAIPGQLTVWQWLLLQGLEPTGPLCGRLSQQCRLLADQRGITTGATRSVDHCGQVTRLSRPARTFPEAILAEVCGQAA
jgi:prophage antirepressor-like protein